MSAHSTSPLFLAEKAQQMAKHAHGEGAMFHKIALISMCVVAVSAGTQVLLQLWRELNKPEKGHGGMGR